MKTFETEKHNIPEGATHYENETSISYFAWFKLSGDDLLCMPISNPDMWLPCSLEFCKDSITPIPQTKEVEWVNGLPPAGVECEFEYPCGRWNKGYYHGKTISGRVKIHILEYKGGEIETLGDLVKFRKPETQEDRDRRERERLENGEAMYIQHCKNLGSDKFYWDEKNSASKEAWCKLAEQYRKESE